MASIQKLIREKAAPITGKMASKTSYRVYIRINGLRPITKSFGTKRMALAHAARIEVDHEAAIALGGDTTPYIDCFNMAFIGWPPFARASR
jgi:hypothetical protein